MNLNQKSQTIRCNGKIEFLWNKSGQLDYCPNRWLRIDSAAQNKETVFNNLLTHITTTVSYSLCGKDEEARETAAGVIRINPNFSCDYFAKKLPYKNKADLDLYIGALRKAGLK